MATILDFDGGSLVLTEIHLMHYQGERLQTAFRRPLVTAPAAEERSSFRHPVLGLVLGVGMLAPSCLGLAVMLIGGSPVGFSFDVGRFWGALVFGVFFGLLFLAGVATARRVRWLRFRYAGGLRLVALPGVAPDALERFLAALTDPAPPAAPDDAPLSPCPPDERFR